MSNPNIVYVGKTMSEEQIKAFVNNIKRVELEEEVAECKANGNTYPRYLKGVVVTLHALGYNEYWVERELRDALDKEYLCNKEVV